MNLSENAYWRVIKRKRYLYCVCTQIVKVLPDGYALNVYIKIVIYLIHKIILKSFTITKTN